MKFKDQSTGKIYDVIRQNEYVYNVKNTNQQIVDTWNELDLIQEAKETEFYDLHIFINDNPLLFIDSIKVLNR